MWRSFPRHAVIKIRVRRSCMVLPSFATTRDVLLVRHVFDPNPLRDLFANRGFVSWAEERRPDDWYIYFYRPTAFAAAVANAPANAEPRVPAAAASA